MFGKQLANPAYPKMDTGVNPISLIKVGLIDPKNGIVAPNEPQLVIEKSAKLTLSEKICYSLVVILVVGGLVGIITYRILQESSSMPGPGGYGGGMRGKSLSSSQAIRERSLSLGASRLALADDAFRRGAYFSNDGEFGSLLMDNIRPDEPSSQLADDYFKSFALIKMPTISSNGSSQYKYCAGVIISLNTVITTRSCVNLVGYNNTSRSTNETLNGITVYTGIDQNSIGMILNGNLTEQINAIEVASITKGNGIDPRFSILNLKLEMNATKVRVAEKTEDGGIFSYGYFVCIRKNMKPNDKPVVYWLLMEDILRLTRFTINPDDSLLDGLAVYNSDASDLTLFGLYKYDPWQFVQYSETD